MKRFFLAMTLMLIVGATYSQPKPKAGQKDKPPTQKEVDEMMKEMQQAMNEMSPEDKKMIDSLGIKMPSTKDVPRMSDKQLADAWEQDTRLVPKKDAARLSAIPPAPATAALPAFIVKVSEAVAAKLSAAERTDAQTVYQSIKQNPEMSTGSAAIAFWIQGQPMLAAYLMGRACQDKPADIDNINNYAAMLTMLGAEQAALPILQNLNKRFPKNSTILNNIGQAWFGLGDIDKASRYLDSTILIYAWHSQANYTKSLIEESKGNTTAAAEALMRSVKKSHSVDKENKLRQLGKKLSGKDVDFPFPMPQDPLGLEKFSWPAYPMSVAESAIQEKAWEAFKEQCNADMSALKAHAAQLEKNVVDAIGKRGAAMVQASVSGKMFNPLPWYAPIAILKLNYLVEDKDNGLQYRMKKTGEAGAEAMLKDAEWSKERTDAEEALSKKYDPLIGEGRPNPLQEYCGAVNSLRDAYLKKANTELQMAQKAIIEDERKYLNNQVYYSQYINWPEEFELIKTNAKIAWLTGIKDQAVRFLPKGPFCEIGEGKKQEKTKLQEFDDIACKYHSSVDFELIEFNNDCRYFEGKLKLGAIKYTRRIDSDDHDRLLSASLEIKASASKGWEKGPVQAEATAEVRGKMEWNDKEVTNWEVSSEVGVSAGSNLGHGDKSIDIAGVKAQVGMNSGSSLNGKGLLQNLNVNSK